MGTTLSTPRFRWLVLSFMLLAVALVWISRDAAKRRVAQQGRQAQVEGMVHLLGTADLALSSASRWLRHPSLTEPGAPFADGPAILDADPAGAVIGPPRDLLRGMGSLITDP